MDYKFTFQDGSESLMHYGVKGMKWGVWNAETRNRYLNTGQIPDAGTQRKLAKQTEEGLRNGRPWVDNYASVPLAHDVKQRLSKAKEEFLKSDPLGEKYYSDPELQRKYKIKLADQMAKKYDDTPEGREHYRRATLYDDLDQGSQSEFTFESSFDLYVKDQVKDPDSYYAKQRAAVDKYIGAAKNEVDRVLGDYGKKQTSKKLSRLGVDTSISREVALAVLSLSKDEMYAKRKYF